MAYSLTGMHHLLITCRSMQETLPFYQDVLGMRVVRTAGGAAQMAKVAKLQWDQSVGSIDDIPRTNCTRQYFLEFGWTQLAIVEIPGAELPSDGSVYLPLLWPGAGHPGRAKQVDHIAFSVESREAVVWYRERLIAHGIPVSEIEEANQMIHSIYFYGPNGIALEIASSNPNPPHRGPAFYDPDPVPALRMVPSSSTGEGEL